MTVVLAHGDVGERIGRGRRQNVSGEIEGAEVAGADEVLAARLPADGTGRVGAGAVQQQTPFAPRTRNAGRPSGSVTGSGTPSRTASLAAKVRRLHSGRRGG